MAITTTASTSAVTGERPKRRSFKLKERGTTMAMRGGRKKKKKTRGGKRK